MPKTKHKRKRVPHKFWPDIHTRYNAIHCENASVTALQIRASRQDSKVLAVIAEVVLEKKQEAEADAKRATELLKKANMLEA